ncbi:hypothetical protein GCM10010286_52450 [Streptomyces toxytricini]|nr:hypothetical protein GCM10010286_52450 [Streptomyces toxytricini]
MAGVITASEPAWTAPFAGLSPRQFGQLINALRREGSGSGPKGPAVERAAGGPDVVVIGADTRLVVTVGRPLPGNGNDCRARELSGAKAVVGRATVIADGGYRRTGLVIPHRRERGQTELPAWKEEHNTSHRKVRARVEHVFARLKQMEAAAG